MPSIPIQDAYVGYDSVKYALQVMADGILQQRIFADAEAFRQWDGFDEVRVPR